MTMTTAEARTLIKDELRQGNHLTHEEAANLIGWNAAYGTKNNNRLYGLLIDVCHILRKYEGLTVGFTRNGSGELGSYGTIDESNPAAVQSALARHTKSIGGHAKTATEIGESFTGNPALAEAIKQAQTAREVTDDAVLALASAAVKMLEEGS